MIARGILLPLTILAKDIALHVHAQEIWLVRKEENPNVRMTVNRYGERAEWISLKDSLLLIDCAILTVTSGTLAYRKLQVDKLAKFLAFIDEANPESSTITAKGHFFECVDCDDCLVFSDISRTEEWFLAEYMMKRSAFNPLNNLLRKTESYGLVRYLLVQSLQQFSLSELGKIYGVSYSHFRRLCHSALGGKVKVELCNWRMIRAVLEITEGSNDVTTVVYKYGYSSPSHFFAEVKSRLGNFPVCLWKKK